MTTHGRTRALLLRTLGASSLLTLAAAGSAIAFHGYSHAWDNSEGSHYTMGRTIRTDESFSIPGTSNCTTYYTGSPVYQTMWLKVSSDFLELGTADQCHNFEYLYWGYSYNGTWHSLGTDWSPNTYSGGLHEFVIRRVDGNIWHYKLDDITVDTLTWSAVGTGVDVGMESYSSAVTAPVHQYTQLAYRVDDGVITAFSGHDGHQVNDPPLCFDWLAPAKFAAAENATC